LNGCSGGNMYVSIHAFRGEGDTASIGIQNSLPCFNPRLPGGRRPPPRVLRSVYVQAFQSTPSGGKATGSCSVVLPSGTFQSTPSGGKATARAVCQYPISDVSIHAFRGEGDRSAPSLFRRLEMFQSTPSGGKATAIRNTYATYTISFNPRLPGGRRQCHESTHDAATAVSIHAFRGEGDRSGRSEVSASPCFNPRLPGGRRLQDASDALASGAFQSTPSGGKATMRRRRVLKPQCCFNPRLPGGRRPRVGSTSTPILTFQSTPSGGKATARSQPLASLVYVSIHAFRGEGDQTPTGKRLEWRMFQSTPSGGKATNYLRAIKYAPEVSIHAFRGEGDII